MTTPALQDDAAVSVTGRTLSYAVATGVSVLVAIVLLPITTRVLGPREYGAFAVAWAYVSAAGTLANAGLSFVLTANLPRADRAGRRTLVSTAFAVNMAAAAMIGAVLVLGRPGVARLPGLAALPASTYWLLVAAVVLAAPALLTTDLLMIDGRAAAYARIVVAQTATGAAVTVFTLFAMHRGGQALFLGAVAAQAVTFVGMVLVLLPDLGLAVERRWLVEILRVAPAALAAGIAESTRTVVERSVLAAYAGIAQVGLYAHAQQYRVAMSALAGPVSRAVYPVSVREAHQSDSAYPGTYAAWSAVQLFGGAAGVLFACIGPQLIGLLTHQQFVGAAPYAVGLMVWFMLLTTGKPQAITLLALGYGRAASVCLFVTIVIGVATTVLTVPALGGWGAVLGLVVQATAYRISVGVIVSKLRHVPFQDAPALFGLACTGLAAAIIRGTGPGVVAATGLMLVLWLLLAVAAWRFANPTMRRLLSLSSRVFHATSGWRR